MTQVFKYSFTEDDLKNYSETKFIDCDKKFLKTINEVRNLNYYYKKYHLPKYEELTITKYENIQINPNGYKDDYECRNYSYQQTHNNTIIKKCLPLFYGNADSFQHFLMHLYPILVFLSNRDFFTNNPDIVIAIYPIKFDSFDYLIDKLKISLNSLKIILM